MAGCWWQGGGMPTAALAGALALVIGACSNDDDPRRAADAGAEGQVDSGGPDVGLEQDAGTDAFVDSGTDGGVDAGVDAGSDGGLGRYAWDRVYGGARFDRAHAVAVDGEGNVYVAGAFQATADFGGGPRTAEGNHFAGYLASYTAEGAYRFDRVFDGGSDVFVRAIAVDPTGRVRIVGSWGRRVDFGGGPRESANQEAFLASFSSEGAYQWDRHFGGEIGAHLADGQSVTLDAEGNIYIAGAYLGGTDFGGGLRRTGGDEARFDAFVASYDAEGVYRFDRTYGGETDQYAYAVATDAEGNVYVGGDFNYRTDFGGGERLSGGYSDGFVLSLSSEGTYRFDRTFGGSGIDTARAIAVDDAGNVLVGGSFAGTVDFGGGAREGTSLEGGYVLSIGADGGYRFDRIYRGARGVFALATDGDHNLFICGALWSPVDFGGGARGTSGQYGAFVASFSADGGYRFDRAIGRRVDTRALALAGDGRGGVFAAGGLAENIDLGGGLRTAAETDAFVLHIAP